MNPTIIFSEVLDMEKSDSDESLAANVTARLTTSELKILDIWKSINQVRSRREALEIIFKLYLGIESNEDKLYKKVKLEDIKKIIK